MTSRSKPLINHDIDPTSMFTTERSAFKVIQRVQAEIHAILALSISWDDKHALVFCDRRSGAVFESFETMGLDFEWVHPEDGGEDVARLFSKALDARISKLATLAQLARP